MKTNTRSLEMRAYTPDLTKRAKGTPDILALLVIVLTVVLLSQLAGERTLAGYGTETDFIGSMVDEAKRFLAGTPLKSEFHPPFFALTLATVFAFLGDWLVAGKTITLISAAVTLFANYVFFRLLFNGWIGLGAVIGLISGAVFFTFSIQATSDVFALALYSLTFMFAALAATNRSPLIWYFVGVLVVVTLMTRTNGITLVALIVVPVLQLGARYKILGLLAALAGTCTAILAFIGFAYFTGSSLMPEGTYHNLALTYFTDERIAWEGMVEARSRFNSLTDVLSHDPARMIKVMVRNLYDVSVNKLPFLAGPILALLFLPGLILAAAQRQNLLFLAFLTATIGQLLLVNLKAYEPRYHMYFLPWLGAGSVLLVGMVLLRDDISRILRWGLAGILLPAMFLGPVMAYRETARFAADGGNPEIAAVLQQVHGLIGQEDAIVARKRHLAFYTGAKDFWLEQLSSAAELRALLEAAAKDEQVNGSAYLFIGEIERVRRPDIVAMVDTELEWLVVVANGNDASNKWNLYRYEPVSGI